LPAINVPRRSTSPIFSMVTHEGGLVDAQPQQD